MIETEHPADLIAEADRLEREADSMWAQVKERRGKAAALRFRARRILDEVDQVLPRRASAPDPMLAAAGLAVEEFPGLFTPTELGVRLQIRDPARLTRILGSLAQLGHVRRIQDGRYRTVDPDEARVRDAVIELGSFTVAQLADKLEVQPHYLTHYLDQLRDRQLLAETDGTLSYIKSGPERATTRRPNRPPPERTVAGAYAQAPDERGLVMEFTGKGTVPERGSEPKRHADIQRRRAAGRKGKSA